MGTQRPSGGCHRPGSDGKARLGRARCKGLEMASEWAMCRAKKQGGMQYPASMRIKLVSASLSVTSHVKMATWDFF